VISNLEQRPAVGIEVAIGLKCPWGNVVPRVSIRN
jgi:hypothetical protein